MAPAPLGAAASRPVPRRGLRRAEAATYVGVSASKFDNLVDDRRMPSPRVLDGCMVWDVREIDDAFDALPRKGQPVVVATSDTSDDPWSNPRA